jgi:hypothetical protein
MVGNSVVRLVACREASAVTDLVALSHAETHPLTEISLRHYLHMLLHRSLARPSRFHTVWHVPEDWT